MIPFLDIPPIALGPITIQPFGLSVAAAAMIGLAIAQKRYARYGLDPMLGERLSWWAVIGGFLGAHLFAVLFYFPGQLARDPLLLIRLWDHISSFGGMLGGAIGGALFLKYRAPKQDERTRWSYLDAAAVAFAVSLTIGRIGCAMVHDHPGRVTDFPLAVSLETPTAQALIASAYAGAHAIAEAPLPASLAALGFHDLGLYELLYLALIVLPLMWLLDRTPRRPGFFVVVFAAMYMPVRFALDFLRVSDATYGGLTPAQWAAVAALLALPLVWKQMQGWPPIARHAAPAASTVGQARSR